MGGKFVTKPRVTVITRMTEITHSLPGERYSRANQSRLRRLAKLRLMPTSLPNTTHSNTDGLATRGENNRVRRQKQTISTFAKFVRRIGVYGKKFIKLFFAKIITTYESPVTGSSQDIRDGQ